MEKNITVSELVDKWSSFTTGQLQEKYLNDTIKTEKYVPYLTKKAICEAIVKVTMTDENGNFHVDRANEFVLFTMKLIDTYTNVEIEKENIAKNFDALNEIGLLEEVTNIIPEKEFAEFTTVMSLVRGDFKENYFDTHAFVNRQVDKLKNLIDVLAAPIMDKLANINLDELLNNNGAE